MYFKKEGGKQILDLKGDLVLTKNNNLVIGRVKSAAPAAVRNGKYILLNKLGFFRKIQATLQVINFIWSRIEPIDHDKE